MNIDKKVKLKRVGWTETRGDAIETNLEPVSIDDFNLLIGDNAQGKTRFFGSLMFVRNLILNMPDPTTGRPKVIQTNFNAQFEFEILKDEKEESLITYKLKVKPSQLGNVYSEEFEKDGKLIFSTEQKIAYDEIKLEKIENVFLPQNTLAISALSDERFETIKLICGFFKRILFLSANKTRGFGIVPPNVLIPDLDGATMPSVLTNWSVEYPNLYNEVVDEWKNFFESVENVEVKERKIAEGMSPKFLIMHEKGIQKEIFMEEWSDGMLRVLNLIAYPKVQFQKENSKETLSASLLCIDEIENGLDYKRLRFISKYLQECSDDLQIIFSSHSPLLCDFVHPKYWRVIKRSGTRVKVFLPSEVDKPLEKNLDDFGFKHWEFYMNHISNSGLYK